MSEGCKLPCRGGGLQGYRSSISVATRNPNCYASHLPCSWDFQDGQCIFKPFNGICTAYPKPLRSPMSRFKKHLVPRKQPSVGGAEAPSVSWQPAPEANEISPARNSWKSGLHRVKKLIWHCRYTFVLSVHVT